VITASVPGRARCLSIGDTKRSLRWPPSRLLKAAWGADPVSGAARHKPPTRGGARVVGPGLGRSFDIASAQALAPVGWTCAVAQDPFDASTPC